jgi:hypothetical protein
MPSTADGAGSTSAANAEVLRLRARIAELEKQLATEQPPITATPPARRPRERWRAITATVLVTLGCLVAPLAVLAVWANDEVSSTDRYVQTVSPLAQDPAVQSAVTDEVTRQIFTYVDVKSLVTQATDALGRQGLPPEVAGALQGLSTPIAGGVESFTRDEVAKIVASPAFATAWDQANRAAHEQVVTVLSGQQGGAVSAQNGAVTLNLGPFVAQVKQRLVAEGFTIANNIPAVDASVTIFQSDQITRWQNGYRLLNTLGDWLPGIALALIALGVYVARSHRRALLGAALGVAAGMLALGAGLAIARSLYLDAVPADVLPADAATAVFDTLVRFLQQALRATLVAALIVAAAAFLTGGSPTAERVRGALSHGIGWLRGGAESAGLRTGRLGTWVHAHRRWLRILVVAAAAVVLTFWSHPTVTVVVVTALLALLGLVVVEFLGRPPAPAAEPGIPRQVDATAGADTTTAAVAPPSPDRSAGT